MEVIKSIPRGYCHGVVNALNICAKTIKNTNILPIYILGEIVHNKKITDAFLEAGAITLSGDTRENLLNTISSGTVIITAHGIDPTLIKKAKDKGLNVVDATCNDVYKTHNIIKKYLEQEYDIIYIGKKNHPETEGVLGINPKIHLVCNEDDMTKLHINNNKIMVTNQTTMSKFDIQHMFEKIKNLYPTSLIIDEICKATSTRQEIALKNSKLVDFSYVVGDKNSNNTNKLVEICQKNSKTCRIDTIEDINIKDLLNINKVHVTSGASTPSILTNEVIKFLENFDKNNKETHITKSMVPLQRIIPKTK